MEQALFINEIQPGKEQRINILGRVIRKYDVKYIETQDGSKRPMIKLVVGDKTGTITVTIFGNLVARVKDIEAGTIIKIINPVAKEYNGRIELTNTFTTRVIVDEDGSLADDPRYETVPQLTEFKIERQYPIVPVISAIEGDYKYVAIEGTVVRIYSVNVITEKDNASDQVIPKYIVAEFAVGDETGVIRCVAFNENAEELLETPSIEIVSIFNSVSGEKKHKIMASEFSHIVGKEVRVSGKVIEHETFGKILKVYNIESISEDDIEREIEKLLGELGARATA